MARNQESTTESSPAGGGSSEGKISQLGKFKSIKLPYQSVLSKRLNRVHDLNNKMLSEEHEERIIKNAGTVQKFGDFKYQDGGTVPVGEPYHIHYSRIGKSEIYMTGNKHDETSLIIDRLKGNTNFGQYVKVKKPPKGMTYLNKHIFKVTKKHRKIGHARRYFARQGNNLTSPIFEISKTDYGKDTPFYKKTEMKWSLDINKGLMENNNIDEINRVVNQGFNSLEYALNPSEGHILRDKSSQNEKLNKLLSKEEFVSPKRKKRKTKKNLMNQGRKTFSTSTPTSTESSPGGGGGAY